MPTHEETRKIAVDLFKSAIYPTGLSLQTAWLGIYQVLLWYSTILIGTTASFPHIIDADKFRPGKKNAEGVWRRRARQFEMYLANTLSVGILDVQNYVDLLMRHSAFAGMQRQNSLGIAAAGLICHVFHLFGNTAFSYEPEFPADQVFPGIRLPGRSEKPKMDVYVHRQGVPRAIISIKWSLRHDRINDITNECPTYKAAASYRRIRPFDYYVVTNEFDPARLKKVLSDDCISGLAHIHKPAVITVCNLNSRLNSTLDLTDLVNLSLTWS